MSKRASYREGVAWIAENDEPGDFDPDTIDGYISTQLLADLFRKPAAVVAKDIARYRRKHQEYEYEDDESTGLAGYPDGNAERW